MVLVLFRLGVRSQILITVGGDFPRSWTPDSLVQNILVAEGEEVFNVMYNGGSQDNITCDAIGFFLPALFPPI